MTILPNHHHLVLLVEGNNGNSTGVVDVIPAQHVVVVGEGVSHDVPDCPLIHRLGAEDRNREELVFRDEASRHQEA